MPCAACGRAGARSRQTAATATRPQCRWRVRGQPPSPNLSLFGLLVFTLGPLIKCIARARIDRPSPASSISGFRSQPSGLFFAIFPLSLAREVVPLLHRAAFTFAFPPSPLDLRLWTLDFGLPSFPFSQFPHLFSPPCPRMSYPIGHAPTKK